MNKKKIVFLVVFIIFLVVGTIGSFLYYQNTKKLDASNHLENENNLETEVLEEPEEKNEVTEEEPLENEETEIKEENTKEKIISSTEPKTNTQNSSTSNNSTSNKTTENNNVVSSNTNSNQNKESSSANTTKEESKPIEPQKEEPKTETETPSQDLPKTKTICTDSNAEWKKFKEDYQVRMKAKITYSQSEGNAYGKKANNLGYGYNIDTIARHYSNDDCEVDYWTTTIYVPTLTCGKNNETKIQHFILPYTENLISVYAYLNSLGYDCSDRLMFFN